MTSTGLTKKQGIILGLAGAVVSVGALFLYIRRNKRKEPIDVHPLQKVTFNLAKADIQRTFHRGTLKTLRDAFEACDQNKDGSVSRLELLKTLNTNLEVRKLLNEPIVAVQGFPKFCEVFDQIDRDGSGSVTWDEFVQYFSHARTKAVEKKLGEFDTSLQTRLRQLFDKCDTNKDGEVDRKELLEAFRLNEREFEAILPLDATQPEDIFKAIDTDHNERISFAEFCMYFLKGGAEIQQELKRSWIQSGKN